METQFCADPMIMKLAEIHPNRIPADFQERVRKAAKASIERQRELDELIKAREEELRKRKILALLEQKLNAQECANQNIAAIKAVVCEYFGVRPKDLVSDRRTGDLTRPRLITYYLCRELTRFSLPVIGQHLGGRDHTTVLSGARKIQRLLGTDSKLELEVAEIVAKLSQKEAA